MKTECFSGLVGIILISAGTCMADTRFVNVNNSAPATPYTSWASAATNIQDAIDEAAGGDLIRVTNGVYAMGGRVVHDSLTNRVAITKAVTVQSVNGPAMTSIVGSSPVGPAAVRCVYMTDAAVLDGFTLTNGATQDSGDSFTNQSGGGVWCEAASAVVSNCVLVGNAAVYGGGGAYSASLDHCTLTGNSASEGAGAYSGMLNCCVLRDNAASFMGGGAIGSVVINSILTGNSAVYGGGAGNCEVYGGTLVGNSASNWGGGAYYGWLRNCISYYNQARVGSNHYDGTDINYSCTTPLPSGSLTNNITNAPLFVNTNGWADLRLQAGSPCINAGNGSFVSGTVDLNGNPRIADGTVDIGAYEFQLPDESPVWLSGTGISVGGALQFNFTNAPGVQFTVLATTNLALPASNWIVLPASSLIEPSPGIYHFIDPSVMNIPQHYYRLRWQ